MKVSVALHSERLALEMRGPERAARLELGNPYPLLGGLSRGLFSQAGLMHMVAPFFPRSIRTDFPVFLQTRLLIERMYGFEGVEPPEFIGPDPGHLPFLRPRQATARRAVVEYSGGKDSMNNLARAQETYGPENVLAVHIGGLAKGVGANERRASVAQAERFGFPLRIVELKKSTAESGARVLRSAKVFDASLVAPIAIEFGARHIITEEPGGPFFTGSRASMELFNKRFLAPLGIPVRVRWWNRPKDGVVRDLIRRRPGWLPHVCNCFTPTCYRGGHHRSWDRRTPTFPAFTNACGSCVKCRITRLGWLLYGQHNASRQDAVYFIRDTERWARTKKSTHQDLLGGSFALYLRRLQRQYGLVPLHS